MKGARIFRLSFAVFATLLISSNFAFGMFGLKPTDNPYFCRVNDGAWETTSPQHIKDINNTGNVWAESEVDGHTLKSRYYFTSGFGDNLEEEWIDAGNAEYMQQYIATSSTQTLTFDWDGYLSLSGPNDGEYWIEYSLTLDVAIYDPSQGNDWRDPASWIWPEEYSFMEDHQIIQDTTDNITINKSDTKTFNFEPGTRFLTWVALTTTGSVSTSSDNSGTATGDANFYNTFNLTNVTGAVEAPVPEPATMLLICLGSIFTGLIRKR